MPDWLGCEEDVAKRIESLAEDEASRKIFGREKRCVENLDDGRHQAAADADAVLSREVLTKWYGWIWW